MVTKPEDLTTDLIKEGLKKRGLRVADVARFSNLDRKSLYNQITKDKVSTAAKCIYFLIFSLCDVSPEFQQQLIASRPKREKEIPFEK